jgi:hypothetical protein
MLENEGMQTNDSCSDFGDLLEQVLDVSVPGQSLLCILVFNRKYLGCINLGCCLKCFVSSFLKINFNLKLKFFL